MEQPTVSTRERWSPFLGGGGEGGQSAFRPKRFWNFKALEMRFSAFWGLNSRTKERVFHSRKCRFPFISHTINSYEQWTTIMKTKLRTFARQQIRRKPIRNFWKNDWNIAFTWLKHNVKPVGLSEIIITFSFRLHDIFFVYNVIQTNCFFFLWKSSRRVSSAVGAYWNPSVLFKNWKQKKRKQTNERTNERTNRKLDEKRAVSALNSYPAKKLTLRAEPPFVFLSEEKKRRLCLNRVWSR